MEMSPDTIRALLDAFERSDWREMVVEVGEDRLVDLPLDIGNGIAMRVDRGMAQHLVHALDQPVGDGVLEELRLGVHLGPVDPHHLHQEQFDQSMTPQHLALIALFALTGLLSSFPGLKDLDGWLLRKPVRTAFGKLCKR